MVQLDEFQEENLNAGPSRVAKIKEQMLFYSGCNIRLLALS